MRLVIGYKGDFESKIPVRQSGLSVIDAGDLIEIKYNYGTDTVFVSKNEFAYAYFLDDSLFPAVSNIDFGEGE